MLSEPFVWCGPRVTTPVAVRWARSRAHGREGALLLDEWHLQVTVPTSVSMTEVETITTITDNLLAPFGAQLESELRAATAISGLEVVISQ
jgi:hypothetical protein